MFKIVAFRVGARALVACTVTGLKNYGPGRLSRPQSGVGNCSGPRFFVKLLSGIGGP